MKKQNRDGSWSHPTLEFELKVTGQSKEEVLSNSKSLNDFIESSLHTRLPKLVKYVESGQLGEDGTYYQKTLHIVIW